MKTPDLMPDHRAQLPRNSHVLSHDFGFTATTGHLLPVFHTFMNPGETVKVGFDFNLRTQPLEAAAFADLVTHVEYFFVPIHLLYQPFENIYYSISNQFSSNFSPLSKAELPLVDMLGCMANLLYANRSVGAITDSGGSQIESVGQSSIRLLDMLGFNAAPVAVGIQNPQTSTNFYLPNVFPYQLLAYHCIYEYFYRMDSRERFRNDLFNWDKFYNQAVVPFTSLTRNFFMLHYRPLKNDYFTDLKVSPIVDVLNLNDKQTLDVTNSWLTRSNSGMSASGNIIQSGRVGTTGSDTFSSQESASPEYYSNTPSSNIQTNFGFTQVGVTDSTLSSLNGFDINTANIRALFANEKLWSITGRAKKTYDDQTLAHFGFKVPHDVKHEITCFGKDEGKIHIGEVISTANTTLSPLGEIAGKGYGSQSERRHSFTAPCHGVVMAIFSVECLHSYDAGLCRENAVGSKYDFFIPEYDHLGMQPLFHYETAHTTVGNEGKIVGWQYRYEQWKRRYNRTTGVFRNATGTLKSWIPTFVPLLGYDNGFGIYGKDDNMPDTNSYNAFLNFPNDVNQMFLAQYSTTWSTAYEGVNDWAKIYDNDPFVVNSHIDCVLVSEMSDYSLPRLDA